MPIYYADKSFDQTTINPYNNNQPYSDNWVMFKLLDAADFNLSTGGGIDGIFQLIVAKGNTDWAYRLFDFIQYESSHNKNIILAVDAEDLEAARQTYGTHGYMDRFLRPYEQKILVHSTMKENYKSIMHDGCLKSWNMLSNHGKGNESPIGHLLGDPLDYSDYIMFSKGGVAPEIVISSKQKNRIEMDIDMQYVAGARFYFDAKKIAEDGLLVRDGAHLKVKDCLDVGKYILWIATPENLGITENTTPRIFAEKADLTFNQHWRN